MSKHIPNKEPAYVLFPHYFWSEMLGFHEQLLYILGQFLPFWVVLRWYANIDLQQAAPTATAAPDSVSPELCSHFVSVSLSWKWAGWEREGNLAKCSFPSSKPRL